MHLRAVTESEIQDDHTRPAAFMKEAWTNHPAESAAGIADSTDKIWDSVNDLYCAAEVLDADADAPWTLPIFGGRPAPHSADADPCDPPLGILAPPKWSAAQASSRASASTSCRPSPEPGSSRPARTRRRSSKSSSTTTGDSNASSQQRPHRATP